MDKFAGHDADLATIRILAWCLIGFAGFLRYSELAALKESDVRVCVGHIEIFIKSSNIGMEPG